MPEFPVLKNDLLLRAAQGEKTERAPVWIMRQAGRYLPEITLQPIRRYSGLVDASIIFSDILVIPQATGMEVLMNPGPYFPEPLETLADISKLHKVVDVQNWGMLGYVYKAITQTRMTLAGEVPLIGLCGVVDAFSVYDRTRREQDVPKVKTWIFKYPEESKALLMRIADLCVEFLVRQVKAGAQV
ncbi:hypothetical protein FB451DRAFT_1443660 [Mycena latifolia]|nr:hypothetical protein FB451DRAFT_1443660 [Mycena latifolia]